MYLAILSQFSYSDAFVRFTGLSCNAVVTTTGTINFYLKKWIVWRPLVALLACSVPLCIWASTWKITSKTYFITLGACLLVAGLAMLFQRKSTADDNMQIRNPVWLYPVCAVIGFLSGFTGIGGGVYLSPLLHLVRWGSAKHIAAASSAFILINSFAGLVVQLIMQRIEWEIEQLWLVLAVAAGGLIGSRLSSSMLSQKVVRAITILLIIFASIRILLRYL